jgi:hypothetical protein
LCNGSIAFFLAYPLNSKHKNGVSATINTLLQPVKNFVHSITYDNGKPALMFEVLIQQAAISLIFKQITIDTFMVQLGDIITRDFCISRDDLHYPKTSDNLIYLNEYQSISELITDVDDYIEFYNHRRFHETLAYKKISLGVGVSLRHH